MQSNIEMKLRQTVAELAEKNTEKISVSALCKKAGVSRASFYLYFENLEDLIIKTREYVINKLCEQLGIILDTADADSFGINDIVFSEDDLILLKAFTGNTVYWNFAVDANRIIGKRFEKRMIEQWGEEYYNENKEIFEFVLNGGVATLYLDLVDFDKNLFIKNMRRITSIVRYLFPIDDF